MAELRDLSCVVEIEASAKSKGEAKALERIEKKLDEVSPPRTTPPFIYKVHKELRHVNEKAYEPVILAIGPYHRGKVDLQMMEEHKLRYLKQLKGRKPDVKVEVYIAAVAELEQKARDCYAEPLNHIKSHEFIEMLVLDGCFIIEFLLKSVQMRHNSFTNNDPIFETLWMMNCLIRDMLLFENQIPFFVLRKLFDISFAPDKHHTLISFVQTIFDPPGPAIHTLHDGEQINSTPCVGKQINRLFRFCFKKLFPGAIEREKSTSNISENELYVDRSSEDIKHILDLLHSAWSRPSNSTNGDNVRIHLTRGQRFINSAAELGKHILNMLHSDWCCLFNSNGNNVRVHLTRGLRFINSATELRDANVEFRVLREAKTMFELDFKNGIISMPPLKIEDSTESAFRNLIAYEQYFPNDRPTSFTHYALLLDYLINSSTDVKLLSECRIIENQMGDNEAIAKIFNQITHSVTIRTPFLYENIIHQIDDHYHKRRNRAIAKLKRNYFHSPWAYISFFAGLLLLSLTIAQTVLSALQLG